MAIAIFFIAHWQLSVFFQTFFLHRYGAHRHVHDEQGLGALLLLLHLRRRRGRASCRRAATRSSTACTTRSATRRRTRTRRRTSRTAGRDDDARDEEEVRRLRLRPRPARGRASTAACRAGPRSIALGQSWVGAHRAGARAYTLFYFKFATHPWMFALLPVQYIMGPMHGAIVNWCGHKYGYQNFDNGDVSRNTLIFDFVTAGELFQNNHHKYGMSPNFAARWFELDPTYQVMRVFNFARHHRHERRAGHPAAGEGSPRSGIVTHGHLEATRGRAAKPRSRQESRGLFGEGRAGVDVSLRTPLLALGVLAALLSRASTSGGPRGGTS